jgi:hypothetical protein
VGDLQILNVKLAVPLIQIESQRRPFGQISLWASLTTSLSMENGNRKDVWRWLAWADIGQVYYGDR